MAQMGDLTLSAIEDILRLISLPQGWEIRSMRKGDGFLVQIQFVAPDSETGEVKLQACRKWYVSSWATTSEVVRTVYKAGLAALEHEFDETFKFKGVAIYNPHLSVNDLVVSRPDVNEDRRG